MTRSTVPVAFLPSGKIEAVPSGTNLFKLMTRLNLKFSSTCGGHKKCGKCKVLVEDGKKGLGPPTETELKHLTHQQIDQGYRLACEVRVPQVPSFVVRCASAVSKKPKLQTEGMWKCVSVHPAVKKYLIRLTDSGLSEEERILTQLKKAHKISAGITYDALAMLPGSTAMSKGYVTCVLYCDRTVVAVEPGDTTDKCLGFAADIGTSKLAAYLVDLNTGEELSCSAAPNPQAIYGDDVMSRVAFTMAHRGNNVLLQKTLFREIARLVRECCRGAGCSPRWIYEGCVVGNPCMIQSLFGISLTGLAVFPYRTVARKGLTVKAVDLPVRLPIHRSAKIFTLPFIAGFVGADTVAAMIATEEEQIPPPVRMLLDIGTNTEVVLSDEYGSLACSCASGPAFEGMHITHGMKADSASIDKVSINPETLETTFRTIDGDKPAGICGSGIASGIAELVRAGIICLNGKMKGELSARCNRIRRREDGYFEFVLAWKHETALDTDITISEKDVLEVQKAKAAICAGCLLLMRQKRIKVDEIEKLIIAGAFGRYLDKESIRAVGMLPNVDVERICEAGNAAGTGAKMALLSLDARRLAERLARSTKYHELAADSDFVEIYAKSMLFPEEGTYKR